MRYLRKITAAVLAFIFVASLAVGIGFMFAVKNVNVTLMSYTSSSEDDDETLRQCKEYFTDKYRGSLMGFVSEDDFSSDLDGVLSGEEYLGGSYKVASFKKEYPCTINVTIAERRETYVAKVGSNYLVYDDDGFCLRETKSESEAMNLTGDAPSSNTFIYVDDELYVSLAVTLGGIFCEVFESDSVRSTLESVEIISPAADIADTNAIFTLRSGLKVEIYACDEDFERKVEAAYELFSALSGDEKIFGTIYVAEDSFGEIYATVSR